MNKMFVVVVFSNGCSKRESFFSYPQAEQAYAVAVAQEGNEVVTFMNAFGNVYQQHSNL